MGLGLLLCVATLAIIPRLGAEFLPEFREGHFVLQASGIPGTSLARKSTCRRIEAMYHRGARLRAPAICWV